MKTFAMLSVLFLSSCSLFSCYYGLDYSVDLPSGVTTPDQALAWTAQNIQYDFAHAEAQEKMKGGDDFWQTPKETLMSRKGVCIDYVSLDVAMLEALGYDVPIVLTHLPGRPEKSHSCIIWQGKTFETETGQFIDYPKDYVFSWKQFKEFVDYIPNNMRTPY